MPAATRLRFTVWVVVPHVEGDELGTWEPAATEREVRLDLEKKLKRLSCGDADVEYMDCEEIEE